MKALSDIGKKYKFNNYFSYINGKQLDTFINGFDSLIHAKLLSNYYGEYNSDDIYYYSRIVNKVTKKIINKTFYDSDIEMITRTDFKKVNINYSNLYDIINDNYLTFILNNI